MADRREGEWRRHSRGDRLPPHRPARLPAGRHRVCSWVCRQRAGAYAVDDSAVFSLRFASGAHAAVNINWNIRVNVDEIEIYGTEGALRCAGLDSGALTLERGGDVVDHRQPKLPFTHTGLVRNFVAHVQTGEPICCTGEDGVKTAQVVEDIYGQG
ncbi:MAG: Gfo/Idh/MocA family oxidoreductase [Candidatus Poribacteria bacterium]